MQKYSMPSSKGIRHGIYTGTVAVLTLRLTDMPLRPM